MPWTPTKRRRWRNRTPTAAATTDAAAAPVGRGVIDEEHPLDTAVGGRDYNPSADPSYWYYSDTDRQKISQQYNYRPDPATAPVRDPYGNVIMSKGQYDALSPELQKAVKDPNRSVPMWALISATQLRDAQKSPSLQWQTFREAYDSTIAKAKGADAQTQAVDAGIAAIQKTMPPRPADPRLDPNFDEFSPEAGVQIAAYETAMVEYRRWQRYWIDDGAVSAASAQIAGEDQEGYEQAYLPAFKKAYGNAKGDGLTDGEALDVAFQAAMEAYRQYVKLRPIRQLNDFLQKLDSTQAAAFIEAVQANGGDPTNPVAFQAGMAAVRELETKDDEGNRVRLEQLLRKLYPEYYTSNLKEQPDVTASLVQNLYRMSQDDPETFLKVLYERGGTQGVVDLLNAMGIDSQAVNQIIATLTAGQPKPSETQTQIKKVMDVYFADVQDFDSWVKDNQRELVDRLVKAGRNPDTEAFLRIIMPDITEEGLKAIFEYKGPKQAEIDSTLKYLDDVAQEISRFVVRGSQGTIPGQLGLDIAAIERAMRGLGLTRSQGKAQGGNMTFQDWQRLSVEDKRRVVDRVLQDPNKSNALASHLAELAEFQASNPLLGLLTGLITAPVTIMLTPIAKQMTGQKVGALEWGMAGAQLALLFTGPAGNIAGRLAGPLAAKAVPVGITAGATGIFTADTVVHWDEMTWSQRIISMSMSAIMAGMFAVSTKPLIRASRQALASQAGKQAPKVLAALDDLEGATAARDAAGIKKAAEDLRDAAKAAAPSEAMDTLAQKAQLLADNSETVAKALNEPVSRQMGKTINEGVQANERIIGKALKGDTDALQGIASDVAKLADEIKAPPPKVIEPVKPVEPAGKPPATPPPKAFEPSGTPPRDAIAQFRAFMNDPKSLEAKQLTDLARARERAARADAYHARITENIASGMTEEAAMAEAAVALKGKLPIFKTTTDWVTEEVRANLFKRVWEVLKDEPNKLELAATQKALDRALAGEGIPDVPGTKGGSSRTRLERVFGSDPELMKMFDSKKPLEKIVGEQMRETPAAGQEVAGQAPMPFEPLDPVRAQADLQRLNAELAKPIVPLSPEAQAIADGIPALKKLPKQESMLAQEQIDYVTQALKAAGWTVVDIGNFIRANIASFDFSFWRQVMPLIPGNKRSFIRGNVKGWEGMWVKGAAEESWTRIASDPLYEQLYAKQPYDFLRPAIGGEEYGYLTTQRPIPRFTSKLPWVNYSQRGFVTATNEMLWGMYKRYYHDMLRMSKKFKPKREGEVFDVGAEMRDYSRYLSDLSGRASLGKAGAVAPLFSGIAFAPRLLLGRILSPRHLWSANPLIRKEAWKTMAWFVGTVGSLELAGEAMGLWHVEPDPRSTDFGKIRIGNTRIDPWGGYQQLVRYSVQIATRSRKEPNGQVEPADAKRLLVQFMQGKASPLMGGLLEAVTGQDFANRPIKPSSASFWVNKIAPMMAQDIADAWNEYDNPGIGLAVGLASGLGIGTLTYPSPFEGKENVQKLGTTELKPKGLTVYSFADFYSDTLPTIGTAGSDKLKGVKDVPERVVFVAEIRELDRQAAKLRNEKLTSLNTEAAKDNPTYRELYVQWRQRQTMEAAGEDARYTDFSGKTHKGADALKQFDKDYPTSYKGDFSQREYAALEEYHSLKGQAQRDFLKEHPELSVNPRDEWLKAHPEEDAKLALAGQAPIRTQEAYDKLKELAKKYDIPDSAIPKQALPPEASLDGYFGRLDAVAKYGANSAEAMLFLTKDPKLTSWLNLKAPEYPERYYELQAKNRDMREYWGELSDKDSPDYTEKEFDRYQKFALRFGKDKLAEFLDDEARSEALSHGFNDSEVEDWVERSRLVNKSSGNSPLVKQWAFDNPEAYAKAIKQEMLDDKGALPDAAARGHYEKWVEPAIRLAAKNVQEQAYWDSLGDKNSPDLYVADEKKRKEAFLKAFPGSSFFDDLDRIEAYKAGFTDLEADLWAERGRTIGKFSPGSAEAKLWLVDHSGMWAKALKAKLLTDDGKDWNIPVLRINAQWREQDKAYDSITNSFIREQYLKDNPLYADARIMRTGYELGLNDAMTELWLEYQKLPDYGAWRDRYRAEHPGFDQAVMAAQVAAKQQPWSVLDKTKVKDKQYDLLYDKFKNQFDSYDNVIGTDEFKEKTRRAMLEKDTTFQDAFFRRQGFGLLVPPKHVDDYVKYKAIAFNKPPGPLVIFHPTPPGVKPVDPSKIDDWYEDDWFLMEHQGFYKDVYLGVMGNVRRNFDKVPTRPVWGQYLEYMALYSDTAKREYRRAHLELDDWLVLAKEYTPISKQKR